MAEVVIVETWKGVITDIQSRLSEKREELQKAIDVDLEIIEKNHGNIPQGYIKCTQEMLEKLRQIDRALEGRFNITLVAELRHEDAWVL